MLETALPTLTYALMALGALGAAAVFGRDAWTTESALGLTGPFAAAVSVVMGVLLAGTTIALSRVLVRTSAWARALHADLRPAVKSASGRGILVMALASGVAEELVFRGLMVDALTPRGESAWVGVALSSVAFGLLHQVRGRARWAWAAWATVTGLAFASIFVLTGSLAGPIVAHVGINLVNLRHLRDYDPSAAPPAKLGGLLSAGRGTAPSTASARAPVSPSARRA